VTPGTANLAVQGSNFLSGYETNGTPAELDSGRSHPKGAASAEGRPEPVISTCRRNRKVEHRALFRFGFDPDPTFCPLNNALTDRKTHARSAILRISVKTFKGVEDLLSEPGLDADPVAVANRISYQILKELFHLKFVHADTRKGADAD
jgi:hypothetical protein